MKKLRKASSSFFSPRKSWYTNWLMCDVKTLDGTGLLPELEVELASGFVRFLRLHNIFG
jgi:hypothetical protein